MYLTVVQKAKMAMNETESGLDPKGDWPGKKVDWTSEVVPARIHVELPFWIAAPDGKVRIKIGNCPLDIDYRNCVVGVYRNGLVYRDERYLMQITAEGYPFFEQQKRDLKAVDHFGERHLRTFLTMPVQVHGSVIDLFKSGDAREIQDAQAYVKSLAHASIRFINEFISAYRAASFDPFVAHVSHWDLPVWHISDAEGNVWHVPMALYPVADELPSADPAGRYRYRTTEGRIREAAIEPLGTSTEELLDAWTFFYRGQFAEAIRKVVTAIEVTVADLLSELPTFRQNRTDEESQAHLAKMRFSDQFSFYLRETKRELPGPLTHIAPEVNGIYLQRELDAARERRHKIVHESEKVDYEHPGPILRVMETMSWLHGWLREDPHAADPTQTPWHSANERLRGVFPFEPRMDERGLGVIPPEPWDSNGPIRLVQHVYTEQLLARASRKSLDMAYCIAWAFQTIREPLIDGRIRIQDRESYVERYWFRHGEMKRPVFLVSKTTIIERSDIEAIACRSLALRRRNPETGNPLVVVNHLSDCEDRDRENVSCANDVVADLVSDLGFTVISLIDWVAYVCLMTQHTMRDFGFRKHISQVGRVPFSPVGSFKVGYVRRVFQVKEVVSIVVESGHIAIGDEICFRCGSEAFTGRIETLEINRIPCAIAFRDSVVGVKLDIGVRGIKNGASVFRLDRRLLGLDESVEQKIPLKERDYSELLNAMKSFPVFTTGFGTYGGDQDLG
ncbi:hypothetical protein [Aureliella helgolandensis]|uniref:Uncharacterized protein n=1 Tax=Aureliella helgolandensis TaxID=2527968 RepID=A0A518G1S6_9BACT|nr:hypothetical protein [Aureliella helgolandensis]QDV22553.1 hypothetical protein Q31a_08390 [Aureliella helgolandensis]